MNAELNLTVLLITHEMAVIKSVADRVAVLDGGRIVEEGRTFEIFARPRHPTTAPSSRPSPAPPCRPISWTG